MTNWILYGGGRWELHRDSVGRLPNRYLDQIEDTVGLTSDEVIQTLQTVDETGRLGTRRQRAAASVILWAAMIRAGAEVERFADFYSELRIGDISYDSDDPVEPEPSAEPAEAPDPTAAASDPDAANDAQQ